MRKARRALRVLAMATTLWVALSGISTSHVPPIVDCYAQARWNGHDYIPTGEWICLK
jgi:hypothetical protein